MGVIEWDTVKNAYVTFFSNQTGYVSVAPNDDKILIVGYDNIVNVLAPTSERPNPHCDVHTYYFLYLDKAAGRVHIAV